MSRACWRLSRTANLRIAVVLEILLCLMALRYWNMGDRASSIALAVLFFYGVWNVSLRILRRHAPPGELKSWHVYLALVLSAINVAIFGFVGIRSWRRDDALFWVAACGVIALAIASLSTLGFGMYFRSRTKNSSAITQTAQSN